MSAIRLRTFLTVLEASGRPLSENIVPGVVYAGASEHLSPVSERIVPNSYGPPHSLGPIP